MESRNALREPAQLEHRYPRRGPALGALTLLPLLALAVGAGHAQSPPPSFGKSFNPSTIGPGSVSTLVFTIDNSESTSGAGALEFSDTLPAGVTIATPAALNNSCGGTVTAPSGGSTISLTEGGVGARGSCSIAVNVTSSTPGMHQNVSGDLTSTAGNSGTAAADLVVDTSRPGFIKVFSPSTVPLGSRSNLTFFIDNSANASAVTNFLEFTDNLPPGMLIASPANASTDCGNAVSPPTLTAAPGTGLVSLSAFGNSTFPAVAAGATCTVTVDVTTTAGGSLGNVSNELLVGGVSSGKASNVLTSTTTVLGIQKSFIDDPVAPGGTTTLQFRISNRDRNRSATSISFTDDLSFMPTSSVVAIGGPTPNPPCGAGSTLTGTGVLTLNGGSLPPGGSCTFTVPLSVPAGETTGVFTSTSSSVTGTIGGEAVTGNAATDFLFVSAAPLLIKEFINDPIAAGSDVTLLFTITNPNASRSASSIAFLDELTTFLPFPVNVTLPQTPCGTGSSLDLVSCGTDCQALSLTGGILEPDGKCAFAAIVAIPEGVPTGTYTNTTGPITAIVDDAAVEGVPATDRLVVAGAPLLSKSFTNDPAIPGGTVNLRFTLAHDPDAPGQATNIAFRDNLNAALAGLAVETTLPIAGVCGTGSELRAEGAGTLVFSGGRLAPGASCSFAVTLRVPAAAPAGNHQNITSEVTAVVLGQAVSEAPAIDVLEVAGLVLRKRFTNDPVVPGGQVNLRFTLSNQSPVSSATDIAFTDDLGVVLNGLVATQLPPSGPCGAGSQLAGMSLLSFSGGSLGPQTSCFFDATLQVPGEAEPGQYINRTSPVTANFGGTSVTVNRAADTLSVLGALSIAKSFIDDPVAPGDLVRLEFTLRNDSPTQNATALAFTDDLDAVLRGLVARDLPPAGQACNGGTLTGKSLLSFSGGQLEPLSSCSFRVPLAVPDTVTSGKVFTNTTSRITGNVGGVGTSGDPARDDLRIAICLAPDGETATLRDQTIMVSKTVEVCNTIVVGPSLSVVGPRGALILRAGNRIIFRNGTTIGTDARLSAGLDPGL